MIFIKKNHTTIMTNMKYSENCLQHLKPRRFSQGKTRFYQKHLCKIPKQQKQFEIKLIFFGETYFSYNCVRKLNKKTNFL